MAQLLQFGMPGGRGIFEPGGFYDYFFGPVAEERKRIQGEYQNLGQYLQQYGPQTPDQLPSSTPALNAETGQPIETPRTKLSAGNYQNLLGLEQGRANVGKTQAETQGIGATAKYHEAGAKGLEASTAGQELENARAKMEPAALEAWMINAGYDPQVARSVSGMGSKGFAPLGNIDLYREGLRGQGKVPKAVDRDLQANHMSAHEGWKQNLFAGMEPKAAADLRNRIGRNKALNDLESRVRSAMGTPEYDILEQEYQQRVYAELTPPPVSSSTQEGPTTTPRQQMISDVTRNPRGGVRTPEQQKRTMAINEQLGQMSPRLDALKALLGAPGTPEYEKALYEQPALQNIWDLLFSLTGGQK